MPEATIFLKRLANMLAEKKEGSCVMTIDWLRCVLGFCLLRSSMRCLRASPRKAAYKQIDVDQMAEALAIARVPH